VALLALLIHGCKIVTNMMHKKLFTVKFFLIMQLMCLPTKISRYTALIIVMKVLVCKRIK